MTTRRPAPCSRRTRIATVALLVVGSAFVAGTPSGASGPLPAPIEVTATLSRTTAASGQVIMVTGSGCVGGVDAHPVEVELYTGTAPDAIEGYPKAVGWDFAELDGTFSIPLTLLFNTNPSTGFPGMLDDGEYTFVAWCSGGSDYIQSATQVVTIEGAKPSQAIEFVTDKPALTVGITGRSCVEGPVHLSFTSVGDEFPGDEYDFSATADPEPDGTWSYLWDEGFEGIITIEATCGDPIDDGFVYRSFRFLLQRPGGPIEDGPPIGEDPTATSTSTTTVPAGTAAAAVPVAGAADFTG